MKFRSLAVTSFLLATGIASAAEISVEEMSLFFNSDQTINPAYSIDSFFSESNFSDFNLDSQVENDLIDGIGSYSWRLENQSDVSFQNVSLVAFLDSSIDATENTYFNEYAEVDTNISADSWEVDEPGFVFGDIYDNAQDGLLDNFNNVESSFADDVAIAFGFEISEFVSGAIAEITLTLSEQNIGGIFHGDADSDYGYWVNATLEYLPPLPQVSVSEPNTLALLLVGLVSLIYLRRRTI